MAVVRQIAPSRLTLRLQTGFNDEKALPILKSHSISNVDPDATDEAMHAFANVIASLTQYPLHSITRVDTVGLESSGS